MTFGSESVNKSFQFVPALMGLHRTAFSPLRGWNSSEEMAAAKDETLEYFVAEYRKMLMENLDDYIENFESYMRP